MRRPGLVSYLQAEEQQRRRADPVTHEEQERAFLSEIKERPDEDPPRLIFADWLEDRGQPGDAARAEFIRIQCALADRNMPSDRRKALEAQEWELRDQHEGEWGQPLRDLGAEQVGFRRGLPETISISAHNFVTNGDRLFALAPLQKVCITGHGISDENARALAASPHLRGLIDLDFTGNRLGEGGARALAASPHLGNLRKLALGATAIGDGGAQALAASPFLANLAELRLGVNDIGDESVRALASSPHLRRLTLLDLTSNRIGDEGARALAASPSLTNLTTLDLSDNRVGDEGALALAASPSLANLMDLSLRRNRIGEAGAEALARSPSLQRLIVLVLEGNDLGPAALREVVERAIAARRASPRQGRGG